MAYDSAPKNLYMLEAEQALLGCVLFNDEILETLPPVQVEHFFDPIHQLIFSTILTLRNQNVKATPLIVDAHLKESPGYQQAGGGEYLIKLAGSIPSLAGAGDYAKVIIDYSIRRGMERVGAEIIDIAQTASIDFDKVRAIGECEAKISELLETKTDIAKGLTMEQAFSRWVDRTMAKDGEPAGYRCGLASLDDMITFRPGKLYIVAGRPGQGKSTLLNKLAAGISETNGAGVAISTLEMDAEDLPAMLATDRMRDYGVRLPYLQAENGIFSEEEFDLFSRCAKEINALPIIIDDTPAASLGHIRRFARRCKRRFEAEGRKLGALIVDYLGLIEKNAALQGTERVAEITHGLVKLAKELDCPILCGCQLNRQVEARDDKRPILSDLRESGDIEQDAFAVLFVYRALPYHERAEPKKGAPGSKDATRHEDWEIELMRLKTERPLEIIVAKHRRGPTGTVTTWCEIETAAIRDKGFNPADPLGRDKDGFI